MSRDRLRWFPFYSADFFSSPEVMDLDAPGVGIYIELLAAQWAGKNAGLPASSAALRRLTRATDDEWSIAWKVLHAKFPLCRDKRRRNRRLSGEWTVARAYVESRTRASKRANDTRWGSRSDSVTDPDRTP